MTLLPSALSKFWVGLYRHTVPGVLHCCLLSSGFCMFQPPKQHMARCAVMLPAAQGSAFTSGVHHTQSTRPSCPTDLGDASSAHLPLASALLEYTSWAHKAEGRNTSPLLLWGAAHTLPCCQIALAPFWGHLAFSEPAKYILSTVGICQSRPKPFTRFSERTRQTATVSAVPLSGDKHLPSPQPCLYPCPLHTPDLPAVACATTEGWLCTQTPSTPLVNGECHSTAALGKPGLRQHSELNLPNIQECGHHGEAVLQM